MIANVEIARIFRDLSDLLEIQGANEFRVRAYRNAARSAETWPEPLAEIAERGADELQAVPWIGPDMAAKVTELVRTGSLAQFRQEAHRLPAGVLELLQVPGMGPRRVRALYDRLKVESVEDLERAAKAGQIRRLPRFSAKFEAQLLTEIAAMRQAGRRFLRASVVTHAEAVLAWMRRPADVIQAEIAGSYRRLRDTVADLDLVVGCTDCGPVIERFVAYEGFATVTEQGPRHAVARLRSGLPVEMTLVPPESFGAMWLAKTGSPAHVAALGESPTARTEAEVYAARGLPVIPPELREGRGEVEAARSGKLPMLLELADIRGDLQMHTTASDGRNTLETMAKAAQEQGLGYIAITDHSPALAMIQGLDAAGYREQWKAIDKLNAKLGGLTILKAGEIDILADGSLDMDDETLAGFDLVVASLHSKLALEAEAQTQRMLRAIAHPSVDIIGHPRGRILLRREGAGFDIERVARAAAERGVMLEVNAQPDRLDLSDADVRVALAAGVRLVISTDAHGTGELDYLRWGVNQARRGWATRGDVANTLPLEEFRKLLHAVR